ncbi:hypothetical protein LCGC14_0409920 [marine sediment metagenome]|uniref:Uncharacterized protein n=1 Tax=marine sediment metagenome TaxID=412755 RepID=A0A0F9W362_9ZZZZ
MVEASYVYTLEVGVIMETLVTVRLSRLLEMQKRIDVVVHMLDQVSTPSSGLKTALSRLAVTRDPSWWDGD